MQRKLTYGIIILIFICTIGGLYYSNRNLKSQVLIDNEVSTSETNFQDLKLKVEKKDVVSETSNESNEKTRYFSEFFLDFGKLANIKLYEREPGFCFEKGDKKIPKCKLSHDSKNFTGTDHPISKGYSAIACHDSSWAWWKPTQIIVTTPDDKICVLKPPLYSRDALDSLEDNLEDHFKFIKRELIR